MGRKLLWFLLIDAILGPLMLAGLCSLRGSEPPEPATTLQPGAAARATANARTSATSRLSAPSPAGDSDLCAVLRLTSQYGLGQTSGYLDDLKAASAALPGAETPNPREVNCPE